MSGEPESGPDSAGEAGASHCGRFLRGAFRSWDRHGIRYVVLRNYRGLPERPGNDVDVLVERSRLEDAERLLARAAARAGFRLHNRAEFAPICLYFSRGRHQVQVDLFGRLSWRGVQIVEEPAILGGRRRRGVLFVPAGPDEASLNLLTGLLYRREVKAKYRDAIRSEWTADPGALRDRLAAAVGHREARALLAAVESEDWEGLHARANRVRAALVARRVARRPVSTAARVLGDARRLVRRYRSPPGLAVVLVGPDGCGKSTLAATLPVALAGTFSAEKVSHIHWKPEVLPIRRPGAGEPVTDPHGRPPRSRLVSAAYFAFHAVEFIVGDRLRIRPLLFRNGLVVIDRYYYDFYVDPARYRLSIPRAVVRCVGALIPDPGPVFYLDVSSGTLRRRKPELPIEESARQREAFRRLVASLGQGQVVDATGPPDRVAADVVDRILVWLADRVERRELAA